MESRKTIVLVLRSGKSFGFRDVELIARHINNKWKSSIRPRIICLWDKASTNYDLGNIEFIPLTNDYPGTWARMQLYSPEMEQYRPFLYVDLDTAIINSIENIFDLIKDENQFIALEDFWQKGRLATPLVWFPANSKKIQKVWEGWQSSNVRGSRMDNFLREVVKADVYWQQLTNTIYDFKPKTKVLLNTVPSNADMICFHGSPRIFDAGQSWVQAYVNAPTIKFNDNKRVTVIIPYNRDRGWLKDAVKSVPEGVQLILSQGEGNWLQNFNKVYSQAEGEFIKYLHEDDMLTANCIEDSIKTFEETGADFIHGNAHEIYEGSLRVKIYHPKITIPTLEDMLRKNYLHSATIMYRRSVFEKVGLFNENLIQADEYEFSLRCLKAGLKVGYCNSTLGIYRRHREQKVRTISIEVKSAERNQVRTVYQ